MIFEAFPKIGRLKRDCLVTEKIDGSNAQIGIIKDDGNTSGAVAYDGGYAMFAGSRSRWLQPGKTTDNFGFAGWVVDNSSALFALGEGRHFGEWWGLGIQRGYGLTERRFSLFNPYRWKDDVRPACCHVVPILYQGVFDSAAIEGTIETLKDVGSYARPGFGNPEGIIVWHSATKTYFKRLIEGDKMSKSEAMAA